MGQSFLSRQKLSIIGAVATTAIGAAVPAHALTINPTFDPSIAANLSAADAAKFVTAITYADGQYQSLFSDPITINITYKANPGTSILGQSNTFLQDIGNYAAVKTALTNDKTSADDATAVAKLPAAAPTALNFFASTAEAKAPRSSSSELGNRWHGHAGSRLHIYL